jgi:glutaredoxin
MEEKITIYGADWCWDCRRAKKFLQKRQIAFEWVNVDRNKEAEEFVLKTNRGMRSIPTIIFPDGSILVEPTDEQLGKKLNLS